jgi:hypothetical protein
VQQQHTHNRFGSIVPARQDRDGHLPGLSHRCSLTLIVSSPDDPNDDATDSLDYFPDYILRPDSFYSLKLATGQVSMHVRMAGRFDGTSTCYHGHHSHSKKKETLRVVLVFDVIVAKNAGSGPADPPTWRIKCPVQVAQRGKFPGLDPHAP